MNVTCSKLAYRARKVRFAADFESTGDEMSGSFESHLAFLQSGGPNSPRDPKPYQRARPVRRLRPKNLAPRVYLWWFGPKSRAHRYTFGDLGPKIGCPG